MTEKTELTAGARDFLERAYLHKPVIEFNMASISVFDGDVDAHEAFDFVDYRRLISLGYIKGGEDSTWTIGKREVDVAIFQMTPLGLLAAQEFLSERRKADWKQKFHSANWAMIGGISATIAALASIAGAYFAFRALN